MRWRAPSMVQPFRESPASRTRLAPGAICFAFEKTQSLPRINWNCERERNSLGARHKECRAVRIYSTPDRLVSKILRAMFLTRRCSEKIARFIVNKPWLFSYKEIYFLATTYVRQFLRRHCQKWGHPSVGTENYLKNLFQKITNIKVLDTGTHKVRIIVIKETYKLTKHRKRRCQSMLAQTSN
jgi:hypothetical protein